MSGSQTHLWSLDAAASWDEIRMRLTERSDAECQGAFIVLSSPGEFFAPRRKIRMLAKLAVKHGTALKILQDMEPKLSAEWAQEVSYRELFALTVEYAVREFRRRSKNTKPGGAA